MTLCCCYNNNTDGQYNFIDKQDKSSRYYKYNHF